MAASRSSRPRQEPLYARIAANVGMLIEGGVLRTGDRIPSVRRASRQHRVSLGTAVQAYLELENRGLIEARPKSGFFVRHRLQALLDEPNPSTPLPGAAAHESPTLISRLFGATMQRDVIQLGPGVPGAKLLPAQKLNRIIASTARRLGPAALELDMPPGCPPLRRALARRALDWGVKLSPGEIVTTSGCMEALVLALRAVTKPGETVAIESPTYFGIVQLIAQLGLKALEIPTHPRSGLDLDALERALRTRRVSACVVVSNFNNPLGSLMPDAAKARLVQMLAPREIPLIEDDLYGDLYFGAERPHVAKAHDTKGLVLLCGSFSKSVAPGFRVGWLMPGRFFEKVKDLKCTSTVATATLPQFALAEYMTNGGYEHHLRGLRLALHRQMQQVSHAVAESFPAGTKMTRPEGGIVLWVELPGKVDALRLHAKALAEKISLAPGPMFSPRESYRNCIRLSFGELWSPRIERAIGVLASLVNQLQRGR
ncbi:MAG TPA: PLP-dependent aminotransferase family protein [Chthoniobacterales bacterium]|nr:PLP-dependent aminotransferase family protein [Chthoniobacterales bacterium]